jgi:hypothetical protein
MAARSPRRPVVVRAARGDDRSAFLDAALAVTGAAWVRVDERRGTLSATLTPRVRGGAPLAALFRRALAAAEERRRDAPADRALRAAALGRALELAEHADARRREPAPALPPERLAEIERLLAEEAAAPRDPLGLRVPWEELRRKEGP